jgi:cytidylate kinase
MTQGPMTATESNRRTAVVIAIDGPAASGKGTLARRLAEHFGYAYFESGLLYRATALRLLRAGIDPADSDAAAAAAADVTAADFGDPELRRDETANAAGIVAANPAVRAALIDAQRRFIANPPDQAAGVVMDGRDIGTIICPDADHKIFVYASLEVRAQRRLKELRERGVEGIESRVLQDMSARDARDMKRRVAPLVPAGDAFLLDTTALDADAAFAAALDHVGSRNTS